MRGLKILSLLIIAMATCHLASGQGARINVYASYAFDDYFEAYGDAYTYYYGTVQGDLQLGVGIEFPLKETYSLELMYQRMDTELNSTWQAGAISGITNDKLDFNSNYIMLAGNRMVPKGKAEIFGGLMAGVAILDVSNEATNNSGSVTKFAWGLRLGSNIWASEKVGLKLQAMLLSAVQAAGGSVYFGTGGPGAGVSTYSTIYQFSLGGGLTFRVGAPAE